MILPWSCHELNHNEIWKDFLHGNFEAIRAYRMKDAGLDIRSGTMPREPGKGAVP